MSSADQYVAVLFCENGKITREMLYAEFEAILDSFVPLPEYAGKNVKAIYVEISPQLKVTAAVYFTISFDVGGTADPKWNIPLSQLADQAKPGPNLGAGPIRLACKSQCPVAWHVQQLWDPSMNTEPNDFVLLRDVIKRNKLAFRKVELEEEEMAEPEPPVIEAVVSKKKESAAPAAPVMMSIEDASDADKAMALSLVGFLRKKIAEESAAEIEEMVKKQRLLLAAQKTQFDDELEKLELTHSEELQQVQDQLQQYHQLIQEQKKANEKLEQQLQDQNKVVVQTKKLLEDKLAKNEAAGSSQLEALKQNFTEELQDRIEAVTRELNEVIATKDMEIAYRDDEKSALQSEIDRLNTEKAEIISQGGEQFMNRLRENKVSFVVFHPGAGHINIEIDAIGEYLGNPLAYAAKSCKVTEPVYKQWLVHHDNPVCQCFSDAKGEICGKKLKSVINPVQFVPGRSDRCPLHWSFTEDNKAKA